MSVTQLEEYHLQILLATQSVEEFIRWFEAEDYGRLQMFTVSSQSVKHSGMYIR